MNKNEQGDKIAKEAKEFVKRNKREFFKKFANLGEIIPVEDPFTIFMAGSPGAGKTEFSKRLIESMNPVNVVRIDADEIKSFIPQYTGKNSDIVQGAASIAVDNLNYYALKHRQNVIMDGTFANYAIAKRNVTNCLNKGRKIGIFYLYQDPKIAWDFTKKREKLEGRYIPSEAFIKSFIDSRKNIIMIKREFSEKVELNIVVKNNHNEVEKIEFGAKILDIDKLLPPTYNENYLKKIIC